MKPTLLVLAAGIGNRYGSLKQIAQYGPSGEAIIDYSIYDAIRAGFGKVVFVIRRNIEKEFKELFLTRFGDKIEVDFAFQELDLLPDGYSTPKDRAKPWGTGHAIWVAASKINEPFAVINADDFYGSKAFVTIANFLNNIDLSKGTQCSLVGYILRNTLSEHGSVSRGVCQSDANNNITDIVEKTKIFTQNGKVWYEENDKKIPLSGNEIVSMNLLGFTPDVFAHFEDQLIKYLDNNINNLKSEFYLPQVINFMIKNNISKVKNLTTPSQWFGITYKEDKPIVIKN